jgi:hypothetical protein
MTRAPVNCILWPSAGNREKNESRTEGDIEMTKHMIRHIRFIVSQLAVVGFGMRMN